MIKAILFIILLLHIVPIQVQADSVVCVHGFFRSYRILLPLANALGNEELTVHLWDYPSRRKTIEGHAVELVQLLRRIAQRNPGKPIHFVSHSLGGIILRSALNHPDCPVEAKVGKAALVAPPNGGALLGRKVGYFVPVRWVVGSKAGKQLLRLTGEDVRRLGSFPKEMEIMVIAGNKKARWLSRFFDEPNDGKVAVRETYLESPHTHYVIYASHTWIITSRESIHLIKNFILNH